MTIGLVLAVGAAALLLSALGGWPLTAGVLRVAARSEDSGDQATGAAGEHPPAGAPRDIADLLGAAEGAAPPPSRTALRGGTWIGILERLAITATLLAGYPSGIAFVVAVKGLGRYPELRDHPDVSERFVIGTFASMLWAAAVGAGARVLLGS